MKEESSKEVQELLNALKNPSILIQIAAVEGKTVKAIHQDIYAKVTKLYLRQKEEIVIKSNMPQPEELHDGMWINKIKNNALKEKIKYPERKNCFYKCLNFLKQFFKRNDYRLVSNQT